MLELLNVAKDDAHIDDYELDILSGALKFKDKHVSNIMTKFEHDFCVNIEDVLDFKTIKQIYDSGFSSVVFQYMRVHVTQLLVYSILEI